MLNRDVLELDKVLEIVSKISEVTPKFSYALAKNKVKVENQVKIVEKSLKKADDKDPEIKKCIKEEIDIAKKHALKNDKGEIIYGAQRYPLINNNKIDDFNNELDKFKEKNKKIYDIFENNKKFNDEILDKKVDIDFHKIKLDDFPKSGISAGQMKIMIPLVLNGDNKKENKDDWC